MPATKQQALASSPTWTCLQPTRESNWHTSVACLCGQALVIIGGAGKADKEAEVYLYHLHELQWLKGDTKGKGPPMRPLYCAAAGRGESVAVVWSQQNRTRVVVCLSVLSLTQMEWHTIVLDTPPPRRGYRAVMTAEGDVVIFGGENAIGGNSPSDTCIIIEDDDTVLSLPPNECPPPRSDHACTVAPQDTCVIHGGKGTGGVLLGDMWVFDSARRSWVEIGDGPERCGHALAATQKLILMFGGVDASGSVCNDLFIWHVEADGHEWRGPVQIQGSSPSPRAGHLFSLVWPVLDTPNELNEATACFVLYGGIGGPGMAPYHDVFRLLVPLDGKLTLASTGKERLVPVPSPFDAHASTKRGAVHARGREVKEKSAAGSHDRMADDWVQAAVGSNAQIHAEMQRLEALSSEIEEKQRRLHTIEMTRRTQEEQLKTDRDQLERDRVALRAKLQLLQQEKRVLAAHGGTPYHVFSYEKQPGVPGVPLHDRPINSGFDDATFARVHHLERELESERDKVSQLLQQLTHMQTPGSAHGHLPPDDPRVRAMSPPRSIVQFTAQTPQDPHLLRPSTPLHYSRQLRNPAWNTPYCVN
ncbi:Dynein alpha chain [Diplonema papillatum]|nr:Dynein alpha chain [Diplonema papillatum]